MSDRPEAIMDLPRGREVAGHHEPSPFLLTADMFGGLDFELAGKEISELIGRPVADPHVHDVDEIYILISPQPGQAEIDIVADGEHFELRSPGVFRVPAGVTHSFETRAAVPGSFLLGILHRREQ